jgi:hypothetical protein
MGDKILPGSLVAGRAAAGTPAADVLTTHVIILATS